MNDKKTVVANDHMPPELIRRNNIEDVKHHVPPTNVRPPAPASTPNNEGGKK